MRIFILSVFTLFLLCCEQKKAPSTPKHEYFEMGWHYAFGIQKEITLHRIRDSVWLLTKEIGNVTNPLTREKRSYQLGPGGQTDTVFYYQQLSLKEWNQITGLLDSTNFWSLPQDINDETIDGTCWSLKAYLGSKSHIIVRCSPLESDLKAIVLSMILLAGYKDSIN